MTWTSTPARVVIAGAGIGGLEALLALHALAGTRVGVTVLAPSETFSIRAAGVGEPFGRGDAGEHDVGALVAAQGASLRRGVLHHVSSEERCAVTNDGEQLFYDALVVAVGAEPQAVYTGAITVGRAGYEAEISRALLALEAGRAESIAFVVPPGVTWTLPIYELALMTAAHAELHGIEAQIVLVTPEPDVLAPFGGAASQEMDGALRSAGVEVLTGVEIAAVHPSGALVTREGTTVTQADRVIALPRLAGPAIAGLRSDEHGFIPVDVRGRVPGADSVWAIGDATAGAVKQGGLAAQQAEDVAHQIARRAGAPVADVAPRRVLRAQVLEGTATRFLRAPAGGPAVVSGEPLWWPPLKVAAPRLARYLEEHGT
jgi:sulfide:quinone oxidoreductase